MIFGIGNDITAISRFQKFIDNDRTGMIERLFTDDEISVCKSKKNSAACFAARFAAKEAFLKALGTGLRDGLGWHDISVTNNGLGKPSLLLSGRAAELFSTNNLSLIHLSLSHDNGSAIATVVLES